MELMEHPLLRDSQVLQFERLAKDAPSLEYLPTLGGDPFLAVGVLCLLNRVFEVEASESG